MMSQEFPEKVALVSGGGSGIGAEAVKILAAGGMTSAFRLSDKASFVSGSQVVVDGGYLSV